jgi:polyhydroxyalkanoate synthesis regulator protein
MRIIKRYSKNRRLYDTRRAHHIGYRDVIELVRQEEPVQIIDNASGMDLTAETLLAALCGHPGAVTVIGKDNLLAYIRALA